MLTFWRPEERKLGSDDTRTQLVFRHSKKGSGFEASIRRIKYVFKRRETQSSEECYGGE